MDNYKKWILIIIGLIIILIVAIFTLYQYSREEQETDKGEVNNVVEGDTIIKVKQEVQVLNSRNLYYTVQNIIKKYELYIAENNQTAIGAVNLDKANYLNSTNIEIKQIYYKEAVSYGNYYISATEVGNKAVYFALYLDNANSTYIIERLDKTEFESIVQGVTTKIRNENIIANEYNAYQYIEISDEEMVRRYVKDFVQKAKNNPNLAYEFLDDEYKQKKFGNIENFKKYIENNIEKIENGTLTHYGTNKANENMEYYYRDNNKYYFTIKEKSVMNYSILLDEYTIKDAKYIGIYNEFSQEEKVNNNISIFIRMLNEKEYKTAYNLLDQTFRNNNFKTEAEFEKYAEKNFWNNNIGNISKIEKQGNLYLCTYKIKSGVGLSAEEITKTFVMQLKEGTDFIMSFEV